MTLPCVSAANSRFLSARPDLRPAPAALPTLQRPCQVWDQPSSPRQRRASGVSCQPTEADAWQPPHVRARAGLSPGRRAPERFQPPSGVAGSGHASRESVPRECGELIRSARVGSRRRRRQQTRPGSRSIVRPPRGAVLRSKRAPECSRKEPGGAARFPEWTSACRFFMSARHGTRGRYGQTPLARRWPPSLAALPVGRQLPAAGLFSLRPVFFFLHYATGDDPIGL